MTKRQNRPWYLYVLAVAAVAIAFMAVSEIGPPTTSARTSTQIVTADTGIVQSTVTGTGNVEAGTDLNVNFQTSGTLSRVDVKAGQHVDKGQLLATLDPSAAQLSVEEAEQNLTAAEDQLSAAQTSAAASAGTTTTASLDTSSATGTTEFVSDTTTTPATSTTTTRATTTSPTTTTSTAPTTSHPTTTPARTTTTTTPATTQTRPTTTAPSTRSTSAAPATTATGGGSAGTSGSTDPAATVASAQAAVYSAEASVKTAKAALSDTKLYAPISGTIVTLADVAPGDAVAAGSTSTATASASSGASAAAGGSGATTAGSLGGSSSSSTSGSSAAPFAEIVNTGSMTMTVALSESDVSKVKNGQPATVSIDALTGVELGANVTAISTVATNSNGVVSYKATLTLNQANPQVKAGMSASASIIVAQAQGVSVPNGALTGTGQIATVTLDKSGKQTQQQVAVGLRGTTRTQIVSGLSAGDQLAVTTILPPLTSGTATTSSTGSGTLGGTAVRPGFGGGGGFGGGAGGAGGAARGGAAAGGAG